MYDNFLHQDVYVIMDENTGTSQLYYIKEQAKKVWEGYTRESMLKKYL